MMSLPVALQQLNESVVAGMRVTSRIPSESSAIRKLHFKPLRSGVIFRDVSNPVSV
jgi:hypothetical protein